MKATSLFFLLFLSFSPVANAQITRGNWLVGGNAAFSYSKNKPNPTVEGAHSFKIEITPNMGYFLWDKLAVGTNLHYVRFRLKSDSGNAKYDNFLVSPFVKYYFLNEDKMVNPFLESSYRFNLIKGNHAKEFSAKAGVAIFVNSSVAY